MLCDTAGPLRKQLQPLAVAAACEAAVALAAAPSALLPPGAAAGQGPGQQAWGLPAVLSSCKALLLACMVSGFAKQVNSVGPLGDSMCTVAHTQNLMHPTPLTTARVASLLRSRNCACFCLSVRLLLLLLQVDAGSDQGDAAAWLVACLLSALHTAVHSMTQHALQQAGQQAADAGAKQCPASVAANQQAAWLLQQLHDSVACTTLGLLSGLFSLGQEFGSSCCKHAVAYRQHAHPAAANNSDSSSAPLGGLPAVTAVLEAACSAGQDELLLGLAAAVAAGMCAGICESLPPMPTAAAAAALGPAAHENFAAAADAAWQVTEQRRQQPDRSRQPLMQHAEALLSAVQAACSRSHTNNTLQAAAGSNPAAAVGRGLLGQAYGRLWATCGHYFLGVGALSSAQMAAPYSTLQQQQQQVVRPSLPGLLCTLQYLTGCCCSMAGVFYQAAGCRNAAAANGWLAVQQQQHPAQEVGLLARWLAGAAAAAHVGLSGQELLQLLSTLRGSAEQLSRDFGTFQLSVQAAGAAGLDAAAVRQQLDRNFAMHVAILSEVWQAAKAQAQAQALSQQPPQQLQQPGDAFAPGDGASTCSSAVECVSTSTDTVDLQAAVVATGLADLAALQFCRVQLPAYVELLRSLVTALATSSNVADAFIATALPSYEGLTQEHPATAAIGAVPAPAAAGSSRDEDSSYMQEQGLCAEAVVPAAVWLQDTVTAAGLTSLLPLLPVAVRAASSAPTAAARVLPLVLLLLPHPLSAVARAAHASFAGLVAVAAEQQAGRPAVQPQQQRQQAASEGSMGSPSAQHQEQQLLDVVQQAVPMYLRRSLAALPAGGSLEGLSASFYSLLRNLPSGSVVCLLAVGKVADRALELAAHASAGGDAESMQGGQGPPEGSAGSDKQAAVSTAAAADKLFELLVLAVQLGDYQLLPAMLQRVGGCVLGAPLPVQDGWLSQLYAGCLAVGDYTRKPALMSWVDALQKQLLRQQRLGEQLVGRTGARQDSCSPV